MAAIVFRGFREKKQSAAKYPRLYGPKEFSSKNISKNWRDKIIKNYNLQITIIIIPIDVELSN